MNWIQEKLDNLPPILRDALRVDGIRGRGLWTPHSILQKVGEFVEGCPEASIRTWKPREGVLYVLGGERAAEGEIRYYVLVLPSGQRIFIEARTPRNQHTGLRVIYEEDIPLKVVQNLPEVASYRYQWGWMYDPWEGETSAS